MINYNSPIIIYALLLDKKKLSSGIKLSARFFLANTLLRRLPYQTILFEAKDCTKNAQLAEKRRFKGNCEISRTIVNRLFQTYAGCFYRNLKNVNYILR